MRWFRRPRGRHALGAAVTAIPSGPAPAVWTPQPWDTPAAGRPAQAPLNPEVLPAPALIASEGPAADLVAPVPPSVVEVPAAAVPSDAPASPVQEAWTSPVCTPAPRDELFGSIAELIASGEAWAPVPVNAVPMDAAPVEADWSYPPVTSTPEPVAGDWSYLPDTPAPASCPAPYALSVPLQSSPAEAHNARVSFGFRDGSTAVLAQDSDQAAALEELAALLTLRD